MKKTVTLLLLFCSLSLSAETLTGEIVGVTDGDTVIFLKDNNETLRVRLSQIDAPEKKQAFGAKAKKALAGLVFEETVELKTETIDKYGRTVGTLYKDGADINLHMVKTGMAHVYKTYATDPIYITEEINAKHNRVGLWSQENPVDPWLFRKKKQ